MPITGSPASYLSTADAMLAHWQTANTILAEDGPIVTPAGATRADLQTRRDTLQTAFTAVTAAVNTVETTRALLATQKTRTRQLITAFNETVRGRLSTTPMPAALPAAPGGNDSADTIAAAADDVVSLWTSINALAPLPSFTAPLILRVPPADDPEGTPINLPIADFQTELADLRTLSTSLRNAEQALTLTRNERDREKKRVSDILRDYRAAIPGYFTATDPVRESLPALTPPPGSTPDPVTAAGGWDAGLSQAKITFTPGDDPDTQQYELRYCPGSEYLTEDEVTVTTTPAAGPHEFLTLTGLATPGSTSLFRVYIITTTGHESGSNTVSVTRPV